jgi:hypothetical protein
MSTGQHLARWQPGDARPATTNFPGFVMRNNIETLAFDGTTQETCFLRDVMPDNYGGGGVTLRAVCMAASATSGGARFGADFERGDTGTDHDADSFTGTDQEATGTAPATSGQPFDVSIAFTNGAQMDSVVANDPFRIRFRRDPADAADTITSDIQVKDLVLREA